jgi:hypothetical protein
MNMSLSRKMLLRMLHLEEFTEHAIISISACDRFVVCTVFSSFQWNSALPNRTCSPSRASGGYGSALVELLSSIVQKVNN